MTCSSTMLLALIRIRSVLGRFLEHARIFAFANEEDPEVYIGSADLMHRNLDRRVEALVQVTDPEARTELDRVLALSMSDETESFELHPDGTWTRRRSSDNQPLVNLQEALLRRIVGASGK